MSFNEFLEQVKHISHEEYDAKPQSEQASIHQEWCDGPWKVSVSDYLAQDKH